MNEPGKTLLKKKGKRQPYVDGERPLLHEGLHDVRVAVRAGLVEACHGGHGRVGRVRTRTLLAEEARVRHDPLGREPSVAYVVKRLEHNPQS